MKNAFITGANIGQANLLTKALAERGWHVYAGVLPGAPTDLKTGGNITVVDQDVSKSESVAASAALVTGVPNGKGGRKSFVYGKRVVVRLDLGCRRHFKNKKT